MHYQITGKQIDIGSALSGRVRNELEAITTKYSQRPTSATVIFSRDAHEYVCEIVLHLSTGLTPQASAHTDEIHAAFDLCKNKMEKQLRRHKRRLRDHRREP